MNIICTKSCIILFAYNKSKCLLRFFIIKYIMLCEHQLVSICIICWDLRFLATCIICWDLRFHATSFTFKWCLSYMNNPLIHHMGHDARKPVFRCLWITLAQTSLRIRAVWSAPLLFAFWKVSYVNLLQVKGALAWYWKLTWESAHAWILKILCYWIVWGITLIFMVRLSFYVIPLLIYDVMNDITIIL